MRSINNVPNNVIKIGLHLSNLKKTKNKKLRFLYNNFIHTELIAKKQILFNDKLIEIFLMLM